MRSVALASTLLHQNDPQRGKGSPSLGSPLPLSHPLPPQSPPTPQNRPGKAQSVSPWPLKGFQPFKCVCICLAPPSRESHQYRPTAGSGSLGSFRETFPGEISSPRRISSYRHRISAGMSTQWPTEPGPSGKRSDKTASGETW